MTEDSEVQATIKRLLEEGRVHIIEKTPSQARIRFAEAWTLARNAGEDSLAVEVAMMLAKVEPQKMQKEWIGQAIEIAEASKQEGTKRWLGSLYSAFGWKLFDLKQYDAAIAAFHKATTSFEVTGTQEEVFVAKWSTGKLLRVMGKTNEALTLQNALLSELISRGAKNGRLFEELAECLHSLKRLPEAQIYFELAHQELSKDEWVVNNQPSLLKRLKEMGKQRLS